MNLSALADFHRVAAAGSLGKASRDTGRPKATLSRRIRMLEESLDVRLVERGAHALRLTAEGKLLYMRTRALVREIEDVGHHLTTGNSAPRGRLRVSAPTLFANMLGGRLVAEFIARYPDVRVDLIANDHPVDLVDEAFDVAIRVNPQPDSELVGRRIAGDCMQIVAASSLPMPTDTAPDAPALVPAVAMTRLPDSTSWQFAHNGETCHLTPDYHLHLSSLEMVRDAVRAGAGVAMLPRSLVREDVARGRLVRWGDYPGRTVELWALHNSRRLTSPKVSAFVEFLAESFPTRQL
ncbi:MAG TPA: LysR family transcriptional regulator [Oleiagrimonas sp.]|nr:LysR family transcriptional regulator [Oleiagrimonas sp.]